MRTDWPYTSVFVLQFGPGSDPAAGRLEGRVEHVASTRSARFRSLDELLAVLAELLPDPARPDPDRPT